MRIFSAYSAHVLWFFPAHFNWPSFLEPFSGYFSFRAIRFPFGPCLVFFLATSVIWEGVGHFLPEMMTNALTVILGEFEATQIIFCPLQGQLTNPLPCGWWTLFPSSPWNTPGSEVGFCCFVCFLHFPKSYFWSIWACTNSHSCMTTIYGWWVLHTGLESTDR